MSEKTYALLSWRGEEQGMHTASEIKRMWEADEISGLFQVATDSGNLSVQEFISFEQEQSEKELLHQQQLAQAQAEADRLTLERQRIEAETAQRLELEKIKLDQEKAEQARLEEELSGKIYYVYLGGQKKGPYSKENLQVMYQGGKVEESTQVWTKDLGEWVDLKGFQEIVGNSSVGFAPPSPSQYGSSPSQLTGQFHQPSNQRGDRRIVSQQKGNQIMKPHRGSQILMMGILSFICCGIFTAIPAWIMGSSDLKDMDAGFMDPSGRGITYAGKVLGLIACVIFIVSIVAQICLALLGEF